MKKFTTTLLLSFIVTLCFAQKQKQEYRELFSKTTTLSTKSQIKNLRKVEANEEEPEFIFNPEGEEKVYAMSQYSYDQTNGKFVHAQSLKSSVRYAPDGKTVYFKDLCKSMKIDTWVKGEKHIMPYDSLSVGIHKGDTIINVPFGQPLAYYKSQYLAFFVPMTYYDNTGEMLAQDNYTLILRGDSLVQPTLPEGTFQGTAGYVIISESKQGNLSLDLEQLMRLEKKPFISVPTDIKPVDYVYSFTNSYGNIYKKKVSVKKDGNDIYMQLSTSAPDAYIKGTLVGSQIQMDLPQVITDGSFLYYYSLAKPILEGDSIVDFTPATDLFLTYDSARQVISTNYDGSKQSTVFSVDYLDGMERCMDYISNPTLTVYEGDKPTIPASPIWRSLKLDSELNPNIQMTYNYMSFVLPALDVDSNYINPEHLAYRVYINGKLYNFSTSIYRNLTSDMTEVPAKFAEGFDFYTYDQLHYVYLYMTQADVDSIGIQSVYTVDGVENCSPIIMQNLEEIDVPDDRNANDLAITARIKDPLVKADEEVTVVGTITNVGINPINGYGISYTIDGVQKKTSVEHVIESGKTEAFEYTFKPKTGAKVGTTLQVQVKAIFLDGTVDDYDLDNTKTLNYGIYTESAYPHTTLLEEFTSESCGWCPFGASKIEGALEESGLKNRVLWVTHHEGYAVDWLTVEPSTEYTALYGGNTFAPAWMLDRNQKYSDELYPVFSIPNQEDIIPILNNSLETPTFVKLSAEADYDGSGLDITVQAEKTELFDVQTRNSAISIWVVEDNIPAKKQKSYDSHVIKYHHNVLRAVSTDWWGDLCAWKGNKVTKKYSVGITPLSGDPKNISVIAFVSEYNSGDINQRRVFNAIQAFPTLPTSIENTQSENCNSKSYNLSGQRVDDNYKGIIIREGKKYLIK